MKPEELKKLVSIVITLILPLLGGVVVNLYHPTTSIEINGAIILYVLAAVIYIGATLFLHGEKRSPNLLVAFLQRYSSLWLLVFFFSLLNIIDIGLNLVGIGTKAVLLLICGISVIGYIQEFYNRQHYPRDTRVLWPIDEDLSPYDFKEPKDESNK